MFTARVFYLHVKAPLKVFMRKLLTKVLFVRVCTVRYVNI